jgi:AcrR family transcriptional regulator
MTDDKPLRADALRNRQRVLEVAEQVFATEGISVPIDEIARRAEVGVGTLYRHFPTKEALYAAVVLKRLDDATSDARELAKATDAGAAFFQFLRRLVLEGSVKKDLVEALAATGMEFKESLGGAKKQLGAALNKLLARAQNAGTVRKDATVQDVLALIHGPFAVSHQRGIDAAARERLLAIVCDGLVSRARDSRSESRTRDTTSADRRLRRR